MGIKYQSNIIRLAQCFRPNELGNNDSKMNNSTPFLVKVVKCTS